MIRHAGRVLDDPAVALVLGIENPQRIGFEPALAVLAQIGAIPAQIADQDIAIGVTALGIAERVELERHLIGDAQAPDQLVAHRDDLDIGLRLGRAEQFRRHLMELTVAPFLRPLVAEHRPVAEEPQRKILRKPSGNEGPRDAGGIFRTQGEAVAVAILEAVHLLRDDVGSFAKRPREDLGELEDRRRYLGKAEILGHGPEGFRYLPETPILVRQYVAGTANRLQLGHVGILSRPRIVIPAKAGISNRSLTLLDSRLRGNDG